MECAKLKNIGWVSLEYRTDGFYFDNNLIINCGGYCFNDDVLGYCIIL